MKLYVNPNSETSIAEKFKTYSHLDFSLFVDFIPQSEEQLSSINIIYLQEPNEYFGLHDWVIQNKHMFSVILTQSDRVINNCDNAIYVPFGTSWIKKEYHNIKYKKNFELTHLCGQKLVTYGHQIRHEVLNRKQEIDIPTDFHLTYGVRDANVTSGDSKFELFHKSQFGIVIENVSRRGYFTEKLIDQLLLRTVPVYWGCSNIGDFFDTRGMILFDNADDLIYLANNLTPDDYENRLPYIEYNYEQALKYEVWADTIFNTVSAVFKHNNII